MAATSSLAGLAPLEVRDGVGHYWEPNVWMLHRITLS